MRAPGGEVHRQTTFVSEDNHDVCDWLTAAEAPYAMGNLDAVRVHIRSQVAPGVEGVTTCVGRGPLKHSVAVRDLGG